MDQVAEGRAAGLCRGATCWRQVQCVCVAGTLGQVTFGNEWPQARAGRERESRSCLSLGSALSPGVPQLQQGGRGTGAGGLMCGLDKVGGVRHPVAGIGREGALRGSDLEATLSSAAGL